MTLADVLEAHEWALRLGGGREGISNLDNIQGALGRPYHGYHRPIARKAAALFHGLATSHGFTDANKRTAWLVTMVLIESSGYQLDLRDGDRIDDVAVAVVKGAMSEAKFRDWLKARIVRQR